MVTFRDFEGRAIRLTNERRDHILTHPEMRAPEASIAEVLSRPESVVQSSSDPAVRLYYRHYAEPSVGARFLCVVVKVARRDAFVITAYLTDRRKKGTKIWPTEP